MKVYGVIMAGGGGTRFWPLSKQNKPKQLLNLTGNEIMVNEAIDRLSFTAEEIFIVTNKSQCKSMAEVTASRIKKNHILAEPSARNTAACIGYAAMEIVKKYSDGIMVITPSDAYIKDTISFTKVLHTAVMAAKDSNKLVTIGISPTFPATGYGYIKYSGNKSVKSVEEFKEKPDEESAKKYIESGDYAWNSGMFIWKASLILEKFKEYIPDIYKDLEIIGNAMNTPSETEVLEDIYPKIRKISIDYAIMEPSSKKGDVLVVPGEFGWNDVGSWDMMSVLHQEDEDGNIKVGDVLTINSKGNIAYSSSRLISLVDVNDLVVVETDEAVMVLPKSKAQDVKLIVDRLNESGRKELL